MNNFPADFLGNLTGFGGDRAKSEAQHRAALKKTPAEGVAQLARVASGGKRSTEFSQAGRNAINRSGITQIRLRADSQTASSGDYAFVKGGTAAKLFVQYAVSLS